MHLPPVKALHLEDYPEPGKLKTLFLKTAKLQSVLLQWTRKGSKKITRTFFSSSLDIGALFVES